MTCPRSAEGPFRRRRPYGALGIPRVQASERSWIRDAQNGSAEAFEHLVRRHWRGAFHAAQFGHFAAGYSTRMVSVACAATGAAAITISAAIDAGRDTVVLSMVNENRGWRPSTQVSRRARVRASRAEVGDDVLTLVPAGASPLADEPYSQPVVAALAALPPEQRAVIVLRHLLDYTPGEIGSLLDLPRGTVNSRLRRGLDALALALAEER